MSGYQSLHDLISEQLADSEPQAVIDILTNKIYTEWLPDEIAAVKETAQLAKKNAERERVRADSITASAQAPNFREQGFSGFTGGAM